MFFDLNQQLLIYIRDKKDVKKVKIIKNIR